MWIILRLTAILGFFAELDQEDRSCQPSTSDSSVAARPSVQVHHDCDVGKVEALHYIDISRSLPFDAQVELGRRLIQYLGYGGFCIRTDKLMFFDLTPDELEEARQRRRGHSLVIYRRPERPPCKYTVVPMGHYCLTAKFLSQTGWRRAAFPVDWSRHTFWVWAHMLADGFGTLMCEQRQGEAEHPYNTMYEDVHMFIHQGGWANDAVRRRVDRLQSVLAARKAFGLAFYFEGEGNVRATRSQIVAGARKVAAMEQGFAHIVLVWFLRPCPKVGGAAGEAATWTRPHERVSVLLYRPNLATDYWDNRVRPHDTMFIAQHLEERFPDAFPRFASDYDGGDPTTGSRLSSCESLSSSSEGEDSWTESVLEGQGR